MMKTVFETLRLIGKRLLEGIDALNSRKSHIIIITFLVLSTYANSLPNGFALDDNPLLLENTAVYGLSLDNIKKIFTSVPNNLEYLPLRDITLMADYSIWGLNPLGYHLSNVLYYLAVCLMLYIFLSFLLTGWLKENREAGTIAFIATLLFAVHPVHVEVVAGISQRKDLLLGLFSLLSLWAFLKYKNTQNIKFYVISVFFCMLSLMSKGTAIILPGIILLTDFFYNKDRDAISRRMLRLLPYLVITVLATVANILIMKEAGVFVTPIYGALAERVYLAVKGIFLYLKVLIIPYPLTIWRTTDFFSAIYDMRFILSCLGLSILLLIIILWRRRHPIVSYSFLWYIVTLLPVLGFLSSHYLIADRYLFLPSIGYCLFLSYLIKWGMNRKRQIKIITLSSFTVLISFFVFISIMYNRSWKDDLSLNMHALKYDPGSVELNARLGKIYFKLGQYDEAFHYLGIVKKISPVFPDYNFYYALFLCEKGDYETALKILNKISSHSGMDYMDVYYLYGTIYEAMGLTEKARESYQRALRSNFHIFSYYVSKEGVISRLNRLGGSR